MKKIISFTFLCFCCYGLKAQTTYSIATDASFLRNLSKNQKFWAFGQTVQGNFHFSRKQSAYAWICYYTNGKFKNALTATAKEPNTLPKNINYISHSSLRYRQISFGLKHYFKGSYNNEESWNLYGLGGFGLLLSKVENTFNQTIDTAKYVIPQQAIAGSGNFKRLTFDIGLGGEIMLGSGIYLYSDVRTWIPASDYPSPYLYNNNTPRIIALHTGIRILFD